MDFEELFKVQLLIYMILYKLVKLKLFCKKL